VEGENPPLIALSMERLRILSEEEEKKLLEQVGFIRTRRESRAKVNGDSSEEVESLAYFLEGLIL